MSKHLCVTCGEFFEKKPQHHSTNYCPNCIPPELAERNALKKPKSKTKLCRVCHSRKPMQDSTLCGKCYDEKITPQHIIKCLTCGKEFDANAVSYQEPYCLGCLKKKFNL